MARLMVVRLIRCWLLYKHCSTVYRKALKRTAEHQCEQWILQFGERTQIELFADQVVNIRQLSDHSQNSRDRHCNLVLVLVLVLVLFLN